MNFNRNRKCLQKLFKWKEDVFETRHYNEKEQIKGKKEGHSKEIAIKQEMVYEENRNCLQEQNINE